MCGLSDKFKIIIIFTFLNVDILCGLVSKGTILQVCLYDFYYMVVHNEQHKLGSRYTTFENSFYLMMISNDH